MIPEYTDIPEDVIEENCIVMLNGDIVNVDQIPFLVTSAHWIRLISTKYLPSRTAKQIANHITRVLQLYQKGGFEIQTILMDNEFNKVKEELPHIIINTTAANKHIEEIERQIHVLKEQIHGVIGMLPFRCLPKAMVIHIIFSSTLFAELPMPDSVIAQVKKWGEKDNLKEGWEYLDRNIEFFEFHEEDDTLTMTMEHRK